MKNAIEAFRSCIERVQHLGGLHEAIEKLTTPAIDASDILRAQIVLSVSALDYYIHEVTVRGMLEIYNGHRPATDAFRKFRVSVDSVIACSAHGGDGWFETEIRERHSYFSFQQPEKIADAVRLFSDVPLWQEVGSILGMPAKDVKDRLKLIVDRRNKIAHEADLDPSYPGVRWPIDETQVEGTVRFLVDVVETIHALIR